MIDILLKILEIGIPVFLIFGVLLAVFGFVTVHTKDKFQLDWRKPIEWRVFILGLVLIIFGIGIIFLYNSIIYSTHPSPTGTPINYPTDTSTPISTLVYSATSTPEATTAAEAMDDYYQCINNADEDWKFDYCWGFLSNELHLVSTSEPHYQSILSDTIYRYQIFDCGINSVGVKYILYHRDDKSYQGSKKSELTYILYKVDRPNNKWIIEYGNYSDMSMENDCDLVFNRWPPNSTPTLNP